MALIPTHCLSRSALLDSIEALNRWRFRNGWKGYDPFGIRERLYEKFGMGEKAILLQTLIADLEKRYHFDRPELFHQILDDPGYLDPKTFANFGTGCLLLHTLSGDPSYLATAGECGDWLVADSETRGIPAWGHPFVWYTEANRYFHKKNNPNIYITSLVVHFLLDLFEATGDRKYQSKAFEGVRFLASLPMHTGEGKGICFWYIIDRMELPIHNGNLFVASVLTRSGEAKHLSLANEAVDYSLSDQNPDGSWFYYGPPRAPNMMMIDNYHSGFILEALHRSNRILGRKDVVEAISKGLVYYRGMFTPAGEPYRLGGKPYPQDIHDAAQGILTFSLLHGMENGNLHLAEKIAAWAIREMQDPEGFFYYRKLAPDRVIRFPYMRWSQAPMFKALSTLLTQQEAATEFPIE